MKLCTETITVFNAHLNPDLGYEEYHGTVLTGVSWFSRTKSVIENGGLKAVNEYTLRIPVDVQITGSKSYSEPKQYNYKNPDAFFTFQTGDIIIHAAVDGSNPGELLKKYEGFTILGVTDNTRVVNAPHWKVVGA